MSDSGNGNGNGTRGDEGWYRGAETDEAALGDASSNSADARLAPVTWLPGARDAQRTETAAAPRGGDELPTLATVLGEVDELLERRRARMGASRHPARGAAGAGVGADHDGDAGGGASDRTGASDARNSSGAAARRSATGDGDPEWATPGIDRAGARSSWGASSASDDDRDEDADVDDLGPLAREEQAAERAAAKAARRAENVAMHALTRRGMSRREMERVLRQREFDEGEIEAELARLESVGLLDDMALAQQLVGTLQERKGLGRTAIAAELTRRLLAPAAIEYALELVDTGDELARAREIAVKRAAQLRSLDRETAVRRLSSYLARRGYSGSTVRTAVDAALAGADRGSGVRFR
ncbi:regulatory protein RecX [Schumannella soli]|uniref:Regulatory protein RecX n=1 Tax=Schumannella soli TaxID=2590779 RepID=A0A506XUV7_9MICO|nr:regulatory protein RecX [Schumannella soli]TPW76501.1 regulatory protein RecX [Schumannella soli]